MIKVKGMEKLGSADSVVEHTSQQCPAYGQKCLKCGLPNHFARRCRNSAQTHMVQGDSQSLGHEEVTQRPHVMFCHGGTTWF